jgi:2'-5' RNA ligase
MPGGEVCECLEAVNHWLSDRFNAPQFPPHITLLASCVGARPDMLRRSARLAATLRPFPIRLEEIDFRDEYFRCLFVHAALTEPLRKAHHAACTEFARGRDSAFMPHLSLLYGNFAPSIKEQLMREFGPRLDVQFKVRSLHLYRTQGAPDLWRPIASFGFR